MPELLRLVRRIRCDSASPRRLFVHRLRLGLIVAALILVVSLMR